MCMRQQDLMFGGGGLSHRSRSHATATLGERLLCMHQQDLMFGETDSATDPVVMLPPPEVSDYTAQ